MEGLDILIYTISETSTDLTPFIEQYTSRSHSIKGSVQFFSRTSYRFMTIEELLACEPHKRRATLAPYHRLSHLTYIIDISDNYYLVTNLTTKQGFKFGPCDYSTNLRVDLIIRSLALAIDELYATPLTLVRKEDWYSMTLGTTLFQNFTTTWQQVYRCASNIVDTFSSILPDLLNYSELLEIYNQSSGCCPDLRYRTISACDGLNLLDTITSTVYDRELGLRGSNECSINLLNRILVGRELLERHANLLEYYSFADSLSRMGDDVWASSLDWRRL